MEADAQTKKEILDALQRFNEIIQNKDMDSALQLFMPGCDVVLIASELGMTAKGADEVRLLFEEAFRGPIEYAFSWDECKINVCGDVAWVYTEGRVKTSSAAGTYEHPYRTTSVLCRTGSKWLWAHYHGSEPAG